MAQTDLEPEDSFAPENEAKKKAIVDQQQKKLKDIGVRSQQTENGNGDETQEDRDKKDAVIE